ncbi:MAG: hypothetical protein U0359_35285 [Byssovorax sp.]
MRIGLRHRRAGMIDRILIPRRASIARMLAAPPFPPRRAPRPGAIERLRRAPGAPLGLIAELDLRPPAEDEPPCPIAPADRAIAYARAGAAMISVIPHGPIHGGSFPLLAACRDALDGALGGGRPALLCHDFVLHPIQLDRALDAGADIALLIARIVERDELSTLVDAVSVRGLGVLVEVASPDELDAVNAIGALAIGVSARDRNTARAHPERAKSLLDAIDPRAIAIDLTGLETPEVIAEAAAGRADAALITDVLRRADDGPATLAAMIDASRRARTPGTR